MEFLRNKCITSLIHSNQNLRRTLSSNISYNISIASKLNHLLQGVSNQNFIRFYNSILSANLPYKILKRNCQAVKSSEIACENDCNNDTYLTENKKFIKSGPGLDHFIANLNTSIFSKRTLKNISHPYIKVKDLDGAGKKVFFKVYGCQMNNSDSEVAWSILKAHGYILAPTIEEANIILIVTCAIREGAEEKIWRQLTVLRSLKNKNKDTKKNLKIGVLGCMAERIGSKIIEKENIVDVVAGPDSYKDLPRLLALANEGEKTVNILLSHDETYADVNPVSISSNKISAFVSIMRGCDNMCSYCIVPFTRGKERSRNMESILDEVRYLSDQGIKEVTLLGQNVNSYRDTTEIHYTNSDSSSTSSTPLAKGFKTIYKNKVGGKRFWDLLDKVSQINPEMRIRFTSPHPKDFPDEVLYIIRERPNICNNLHLPAQCGNTRILELMQRGYSRESYIELVWHIKSILPTVALSSDFICGFCSETEEEFEETLSLMKAVQYNFCYVFPYSMRGKTLASRSLSDDVPNYVKLNRLKRLSSTFREIALQLNLSKIGQRQLILIEGPSKRSSLQLVGRDDGNIKVIIPDMELPKNNSSEVRSLEAGDYVEVIVSDASSQVLKAAPLAISTLQDFHLV